MKLNKSHFVVTCLALICLMSVFVTTLAQDGSEMSAIEWIDCPFDLPAGETEGSTIDCGMLSVPENRTRPGSADIELAFVVIYSPNPVSQNGPLMYLEGGPGGSSLANVHEWLGSVFRQHADLILLDQRGTGFSLPSLNCPELDDEELFMDDDPLAVSRACRDRLVSEGVDLTGYNSRENAADVAALVRALDYDVVNLYGSSYGSRLALTVMRDHPDVIRSVMIDAVYPPHVNAYDVMPINAQNVFNQLFTDCANDAACRAAFPNLERDFYATVNRWNDNPVTIYDSYGDIYLEELTGGDFVNQLFELMYDSYALPYLPQILEDAANDHLDTYIAYMEGELFSDDMFDDLFDVSVPGLDAFLADYDFTDIWDFIDYTDALDDDEFDDFLNELSDDEIDVVFALFDALDAAFAEYDDTEFGEDDFEEAFVDIDDDAEGMFAAVECYEEMPFNNPSIAESLAEDLSPEIGDVFVESAFMQADDCAIWQVGRAADIETQPVISDLPTLVISGSYDPITPPVWAASAASYLPNSFYYNFPNMGHGVYDTDECAISIMVAFLADPTTEPDAACVASVPPPRFITDGGS